MENRKPKDVTTKELEKIVENKPVIRKLTESQKTLLLCALTSRKVSIS